MNKSTKWSRNSIFAKI